MLRRYSPVPNGFPSVVDGLEGGGAEAYGLIQADLGFVIIVLII